MRLAAPDDAALIWDMQKTAFHALYQKYHDDDTNPGNETLEKVLPRVTQGGRFFYLIEARGEPVGAICITDRKDSLPKRISPMFILPAFQGRGYAQEAIRQAETLHGEHHWSLDTILQEEKLCHLYEKMGYVKTGETRQIHEGMTLVYYQKP